MALTLANVETIVRNLISDNEFSKIPGDIFTYSTSSVFTLSEPNINSITGIFVNDVELGLGAWSYDSATGKLSVTHDFTFGDTVEIQYTCYENYSSTEIWAFIRAAIVHLSVNNYKTFEVVSNTIYPEPNFTDKNLMALIAATLIKPGNISYSLPDVKITVPSDLPTNEKIRQIIAKTKMTSGRGVFEVVPTDKFI